VGAGRTEGLDLGLSNPRAPGWVMGSGSEPLLRVQNVCLPQFPGLSSFRNALSLACSVLHIHIWLSVHLLPHTFVPLQQISPKLKF
jgi:hypothetical protein